MGSKQLNVLSSRFPYPLSPCAHYPVHVRLLLQLFFHMIIFLIKRMISTEDQDQLPYTAAGTELYKHVWLGLPWLSRS